MDISKQKMDRYLPPALSTLTVSLAEKYSFFYNFPHIVSGLRHVLINQIYFKQEYVNAWGVEPRYRYLFLVVEVFVVIVVVVLLL